MMIRFKTLARNWFGDEKIREKNNIAQKKKKPRNKKNLKLSFKGVRIIWLRVVYRTELYIVGEGEKKILLNGKSWLRVACRIHAKTKR